MENISNIPVRLEDDGPEYSLSSIRKFVFACIFITAICLFTGMAMSEDFDLKVVLGIGVIVVFFLAVFLFGKVMKQAQERENAIQDHVNNLEVEKKAQRKANKDLQEAQGGLNDLNSSLEQAFESLQQSADEAEEKAREIEEKSVELYRLTEESDTIFNSIDNGVCLLGKDHKIGNKISLAMYEIFETDTLAGLNFVSLMQPLITEKEVKTLMDFLELQFGGKAMTKQLDKFNPLKKIEITFNWDGESFSTKHLGFKFQRVMDGDEVGAVLISVSDLTDSVVLENELKKNAEEQERKTVVILEMLNSDSDKLILFISDAIAEVDNINLKLKELGDESGGVTAGTIDEIYRKIHKIKGNASLIQLQSIVELSHVIENKLSGLLGQGNIAGDQLVGALVQLASLKDLLSTYKDVSDSIFQEFALQSEKVAPIIKVDTEGCKFSNEIREFAERTALEVGKKVLVRTDIDIENLEDEHVTKLMGIITQSVRNSIAHGVELPEDRIKVGKIETGVISIICRPSTVKPENYDFILRDDGAGLDVDKIKVRAVEQELISEKEAKAMPPSKIARLIFESGFSTAIESSSIAGRGAGMNVIKHAVTSELGGKLNMGFSKGHYMMLKGEFPAPETSDEMEVAI